MSDIMDVTKMAKRGIYGNFESKEDLSYAIVDYNLQLLVNALDKAVGNAVTAKEKSYWPF